MTIINQKRLAYLYQAVTLGTVRAAAEKFNVAPSNVSRQISLLEEDLAMTLIERYRKGVKATPAGEIALGFYRESQTNQEDCIAKLNALSGLHTGHISLAIGEGFVGEMMSHSLSKFNQKHPNLTLSITMGSSKDVLDKVEQDEAHIGLLFHPPSHPNIRTHTSRRHSICLIVEPQHPLLDLNRPVTVEEALAFSYILPEAYFGVRQLLALVEFQHRIRLTPLVTTNSIAVMKNFVRTGMGVTFLPAFVVATEVADGLLCTIEIENSILSSGEAQIITRLGRQLSHGPAKLLHYLESWMKAFSK